MYTKSDIQIYAFFMINNTKVPINIRILLILDSTKEYTIFKMFVFTTIQL